MTPGPARRCRWLGEAGGGGAFQPPSGPTAALRADRRPPGPAAGLRADRRPPAARAGCPGAPETLRAACGVKAVVVAVLRFLQQRGTHNAVGWSGRGSWAKRSGCRCITAATVIRSI